MPNRFRRARDAVIRQWGRVSVLRPSLACVDLPPIFRNPQLRLRLSRRRAVSEEHPVADPAGYNPRKAG